MQLPLLGVCRQWTPKGSWLDTGLKNDSVPQQKKGGDMDITIEKIPHSGVLVLYAEKNGYLFTRRYVGYSVKQAKADFRREYHATR